jgi:hypothetical protein
MARPPSRAKAASIAAGAQLAHAVAQSCPLDRDPRAGGTVTDGKDLRVARREVALKHILAHRIERSGKDVFVN